ncbi:uncharacterized protein LOC125664803 [Ostrea edulis]|uniref:uncharacterized protein LOC125664803 n=1 Tax=Ostrea edulis TaxID=37623 RepID=UPI0024AE9C96|nr:uncharacterized protein LOC125664803 [Ostrea edulis]
MAESVPEQRLGTPQKHLPTCDKHSELIDIFCEDCDEFICTDCAKTDHKDHNWVTIVKAASQRRRQLFRFIQNIKGKKVPEMDRIIEHTSIMMSEIEKRGESEMQKIRKHFEEIIARLKEKKTGHQKTLEDNLIERYEQVNCSKTKYEGQKKKLVEMVKLMEENNSTMSDYKLINHHREMSQHVSAMDVDTKICDFSLRYIFRKPNDDELDFLMGQMFDLKNIRATETNSFQYSDSRTTILNAFSENDTYIKYFKSDCIEHINKQGDKKHKYNVTASDICVTDTGDAYFTDYKDNTIGRLSPSGSVSTVVSTLPLSPIAICQSINGGLLVTLKDSKTNSFELKSDSKRLLRHITMTGDDIREYEFQEDGKTRLFTVPIKVKQNGNSDICVANYTSDVTGNVVILSSSGCLRSVYHGQNLNKDFCPCDVVCDSRCNILVTDLNNHRIHLLSPGGEFLKFLLTENEVDNPFKLSLFGSTLWVGNFKGTVKLFQFQY